MNFNLFENQCKVMKKCCLSQLVLSDSSFFCFLPFNFKIIKTEDSPCLTPIDMAVYKDMDSGESHHLNSVLLVWSLIE